MVDLSEFGYTEFEKLKEEWNAYRVQDGSTVLLKLVLIWVRLFEKKGEGTMRYKVKTGKIIIPAPELCGKPAVRKYTRTELKESIVEENLEFGLVEDSWNEYKLEDGSTLRIKPVLSKVSRTDKFNEDGEPIYILYCDEPQWQSNGQY